MVFSFLPDGFFLQIVCIQGYLNVLADMMLKQNKLSPLFIMLSPSWHKLLVIQAIKTALKIDATESTITLEIKVRNHKNLSCRRGFEPRATGFSRQCSNH